MNNFRRQQLRGGFVTIITALLLVVSVAFSIIGYAASDGTKQQLEAVESRYTTIGAMRDQNTRLMQDAGTTLAHFSDGPGNTGMVWQEKNYSRLDDGSILWEDGSIFYSSNILEEIAKDAPQIRTVSRSSILSAHIDGIYGLTSGTQNRLQYNEAFDKHSYNMVVFTGVETGIDFGDAMPHGVVDIQNQTGFKQMLYSPPMLDKGVGQIVSAHPIYERFLQNYDFRGADWSTMTTVTDYNQEEFIQGKQYIFRVFITGIPIVQVESTIDGQTVYTNESYLNAREIVGRHFEHRNISNALVMDYSYSDLFSLYDIAIQKGEGQKNFTLDMQTRVREFGGHVMEGPEYWYALPEDSLPFYAKFEGELEDFLDSEEGQVWRDVIIPMAEINQQSATVMLVEDLNYLYAFNSGKATIVEGREIDVIEFIRGDKVCVVSSAYADYAGLSVGDTLNLDFYDTGYFLTSAKIENWDATVSEFVMTHNPLQESNRIDYEEEYTIVGIYSAPEYEYGTTSFYADTIFVPKASVPNAEEYEDPSLPLLNSVVLMNGTTEEFEEYMESQGFGGYYTYFDQDYSSTIAGLQALSQNALRLVILAGAVFIVTAILFYYLNFKRMIPVAYGMRRMGQHPFKLWWQMEMVTLPIILIAVFGGAYLGVYFFEYVTLELFETNIIMDIETVKWLTYLEAAALCTISLLVAIPISVPRLMKRK